MNQNGAVKLNISYGIEQEIWRVQNTLKKLPWFVEQGYRPHLPDGITINSSDENVMMVVKSEYVETDYAENAEILQREWVNGPDGFKEMRKVPAFNLKNEYSILLTQYGVGGSYDVDKSRVILKISADREVRRIGTLTHEIVHMTIQHLIDKHNVRHWRKERLVDLIMERYFPGLKKMQNIKEDVSVVDQAFENLFPDIEGVTKSI